MPDTQHFSDYGFDPQINYFQFLEEARKHKKETTTRAPVDTFHFRLQKPISKENDSFRKTHKAKIKKWWRNALFLFKLKWIHSNHNDDIREDVHKARARAFRASMSGPVYITESRSGSSTPYTATSRPSSGPLAGTSTPARKGDLDIPYLSLRELTMEQQRRRMSTSAMPTYFVT